MSGYINRVQMVLAETCNELRVNGLTTWGPDDFYTSAKKFVNHLHTITLLAEDIGVTTWSEAAFDLDEHLDWDIPAEYNNACITAGLNELYAEFTGDGLE